MPSFRKLTYRRWYALLAVASVPLVISGLFLASSGGAASARLTSIHVATARTGHIGPGRIVRAATSSKPFVPTAAQKAARVRDMKLLANLRTPPIGPHTTAKDVAKLTGPQTTLNAQAAPTDFVFKTSPIPAACAVNCSQQTVNEPDTANAGEVIMQTSNLDIAYSANGGGAWVYQNPFAAPFPQNFYGDQTVTYIPSRDRFIYEGLTLGAGAAEGFTIGAAASKTPTAWCIYHFDAADFGGTAGDLLDYPKIAYSNNYLYVTWNHYNAAGKVWIDTGLARMPLDSLASCANLTYNYITRTDNFTFGLTYGDSSLNTFYWVSNWYMNGTVNGTKERIYSWPENAAAPSFKDINVAAYNFAGGNCGSQDGKVANWCSRLNPKWETAWISRAEYNAQANPAFAGDSILGVSITAGPGGGDPFPYVIYEYFKLNALTYIQTSATFNKEYAFAYPGCAPNVNGYVGCTMSRGGGVGLGAAAKDIFPSGLILLQDDISPTQPWAYKFNLNGTGNAATWGDYMITQPFYPRVGLFITTDWAVIGGAVTPEVVIWGRTRDQNGYDRWKDK